jgi:hypothetical protein
MAVTFTPAAARDAARAHSRTVTAPDPLAAALAAASVFAHLLVFIA